MREPRVKLCYFLLASLSLFALIPLCITIVNLITWKRPVPRHWDKIHRPSVPVLVPARNEELSIADCVESVCAQTYDNFDAFVYNDQSTDRTLSILTELQQKTKTCT